MKIEKYVVILTSNNGDKTHLKMSVNREEYWVELHLADTVKKEGSVIYLFGSEIAKQELYQEKNDYKVRICAKADIDVLLTVGDKNYVGSTGKTPKIRELQGRIDRQFKVNIRPEKGDHTTCEEAKHCNNGRGFADDFRGEKSQDFLTIESGEWVKNSVENDHCDFIKKKGENFVLEIGEIGDLQQKENERLTETKVDGESHVITEKTDGQYVAIIDRKEAIRYAIANGLPGDVIVIAGKGHEDYQEIKGVKYPMDDRNLVAEVVAELK